VHPNNLLANQPQVHVAISRQGEGRLGMPIFSVSPPFWHKLIRVGIDALDLCFACWQRLLSARKDWGWVGGVLNWAGLAGWLHLLASFAQINWPGEIYCISAAKCRCSVRICYIN